MSRRVVPVSTLVHYIKESLEEDPVLHGVMIEGEISNLRKPYSGHWYFSLKDEKASISCVMFASSNRKVAFDVKNGDKVVLKGDVSVYESMGGMQIIATAMQPSGIGDLYLRLEALKKKLNEEGYFDEGHKKAIPQFAMDIALVTGNNTAAREDVLITLKKRWPIAKITEYPAPVQGAEAAPKIIEALAHADLGEHQLIILARGGGSLEDLWCFNDENLARYIYNMHTPVITGIGHEIDTTLADYVADLRANTPTGAAEAAVPDMHEVEATVIQYRNRMIATMNTILSHERNSWQKLSQSSVLVRPERLYSEQEVRLQYLSERIHRFETRPMEVRHEFNRLFQRFNTKMYSYSSEVREGLRQKETQLILNARRQSDMQKNQIDTYKKDLQRAVLLRKDNTEKRMQKNIALLDAYSPLKVLERGYSTVCKDNETLKSVKQVRPEDEVNVRLSDGTFTAVVKEITNG